MDKVRMIRLPEVLHRVGVSRATLYRWIADGTFPRQTKLGERSMGWPASVIEGWLQDRIVRSCYHTH